MRITLFEPLLRTVLRLCLGCDHRVRDATDLPDAKKNGMIHRILLVSCTALGDTLLSSPAFHSLRLAYPSARITLLGHPAYRSLYQGHPDTNDFISYDGSWWRFLPVLLKVRRQTFDVACILHGNEPQITPLCYLAGIRFIFKLPNTSWYASLLSNKTPIKNWGDFGHGIEQRLETASLAGGVPVAPAMSLVESSEEAVTLAAQLLERGIMTQTRFILFQPGASTTSRRWAPSRFAELGRRLLATDPTLHLVITGSPSEMSLALNIATSIASERVWVSAGEVPLARLPALFRRAELLVSGDTGPMHLAVALDTPVVALFAVSDYRRSGPAYGMDKHVVIQKWRTCDPCLSKRCPYDEPICMENISVDEVEAAIAWVLAKQRGSS